MCVKKFQQKILELLEFSITKGLLKIDNKYEFDFQVKIFDFKTLFVRFLSICFFVKEGLH